MKYCNDIANTVKHFKITNGKSDVSEITDSSRKYVKISLDGEVLGIEDKKEFEIQLSTGETIGVFELLSKSIKQWLEFLKLKGVFDIDFTNNPEIAEIFITR